MEGNSPGIDQEIPVMFRGCGRRDLGGAREAVGRGWWVRPGLPSPSCGLPAPSCGLPAPPVACLPAPPVACPPPPVACPPLLWPVLPLLWPALPSYGLSALSCGLPAPPVVRPPPPVARPPLLWPPRPLRVEKLAHSHQPRLTRHSRSRNWNLRWSLDQGFSGRRERERSRAIYLSQVCFLRFDFWRSLLPCCWDGALTPLRLPSPGGRAWVLVFNI